jgi:LytTr DNA-binding domain
MSPQWLHRSNTRAPVLLRSAPPQKPAAFLEVLVVEIKLSPLTASANALGLEKTDSGDPKAKVFDEREMGRVLDVAFRRTASDGTAEIAEKAPEQRRSSRSETSRIAINKKGRILFINPSDVLTVVGQGNYVLLQCESNLCRLRESMSAMAEKLEPYGFVRIHRSVLVNKSWVEEIRPYTPGLYLLRLQGGKEFTVTRTYKKNLKSLAELWLGNDTLVGI